MLSITWPGGYDDAFLIVQMIIDTKKIESALPPLHGPPGSLLTTGENSTRKLGTFKKIEPSKLSHIGTAPYIPELLNERLDVHAQVNGLSATKEKQSWRTTDMHLTSLLDSNKADRL